MNELTRQPEQPLAPRAPDVGDMLKAVIDGGVTENAVAVMSQLVDLYGKVEARNAEKAFAAAFVALQAELPTITAKTPIPNRGKYEKFEDVMAQVGPIMTRNGFTVSFSNDFKDGRMIETCHLTHLAGHTRTNSFGVRVSSKADTETQADCKAATTARRNSLLRALNIVIRQDCLTEEHDASLEGGPITQAQADELERRVAETDSDKVKFLKVAGAKSFREIPSGRYTMLDEMLQRKERAGK